MKSKAPSGVARRIRQGIVLMTNRRRSSTDFPGRTISLSGSALINDPPERSCAEGRLGNCTRADARPEHRPLWVWPPNRGSFGTIYQVSLVKAKGLM